MMAQATKYKKYLPDVRVKKNHVWTIVGIAGVIGLIYYLGRRSGTVQQFPIPGAPGSSPLTPAENVQINQITTQLNSNIGSDWNWLVNWNITQLNNYLQQNDRIFIGVYNLYNKTHLASPATLRTEFESEMRYALGFTDDYKVMKQIVDRMNILGLK